MQPRTASGIVRFGLGQPVRQHGLTVVDQTLQYWNGHQKIHVQAVQPAVADARGTDRDPRQAERPVRDPSGRGGDGIADRNRRRRTLRRIGLSAAAAVFRPVLESTLGIVYHE